MRTIRNYLSQYDQQIGYQDVSKFKTFSLEKEQPFHLTFNQDIKLEPQQVLFQAPSLELENQIKEQMIQDEIPHPKQPFKHKVGLYQQFQSVKELIEDFRLIQQVILAAQKQYIYSYGIGFDSQPEEKQDIPDWDFTKKKNVQLNPDQKPSQSQDPFYTDILNVGIKQEYGQSIICQSSIPETDKILITIPNQLFNQPKKLIQNISTIKAFSQHKITREQKINFMASFQKLWALRRGINMKLNESKGKSGEHICGTCGQKFLSGRKLGGHVSRKHPGNATQYQMKKLVQKTKMCQKNRRDFFKQRKDKIKEHKKRFLDQKIAKEEVL